MQAGGAASDRAAGLGRIERALGALMTRLNQLTETVFELEALMRQLVRTTDGTGSHFVTQRPSNPGIQRPGDPVDPVTLFYNKLQMSAYL